MMAKQPSGIAATADVPSVRRSSIKLCLAAVHAAALILAGLHLDGWRLRASYIEGGSISYEL